MAENNQTENNQTVNNRYETDSLAGKLRSFAMEEGENKTTVPYLRSIHRFPDTCWPFQKRVIFLQCPLNLP